MRQRDRRERPLPAQVGRRKTGAARDGFGQPDVAGEIGVAVERDGLARHAELFAALGVEQRELGDLLHLPQQLGIVGAAQVGGVGGGPRHPGNLPLEVGQGLLDPLGGRLRLLAHAVVERALDAAIGDPDFHRAVDGQHEHDEADQRDDVFGEQAFAQEPDSVLDLVHPDPRAAHGLRARIGLSQAGLSRQPRREGLSSTNWGEGL